MGLPYGGAAGRVGPTVGSSESLTDGEAHVGAVEIAVLSARDGQKSRRPGRVRGEAGNG